MLLYSNPELIPRERSGFAELTAGVFWKPGEMIAMLWGYFDEAESTALRASYSR
jgi:hypothetical protein